MPARRPNRILRTCLAASLAFAAGIAIEAALTSAFAWSDPECRPDRSAPDLRVPDTNYRLRQCSTFGATHEVVLFTLYEPFAMMDHLPNPASFHPHTPTPCTTKYLEAVLHSESRLPFRLDTFAFGWPFPCLSCARCNSQRLIDGIEFRTNRIDTNRAQAFPVGIHLPLLAANAAFLGLLPYCALTGLRALRRSLRLRRNHCPTCNYDLTGTPQPNPCPECGRPAASPAPAGEVVEALRDRRG